MPAYDFSTLSPCDFEELSRDLLQEEFDVTLECFKSGRDQGIDLRYSKQDDSGDLIVQCKHYLRSGYAKLKSALQNDELPKIARLNPKRYVLTTSVGLSPANKAELQGILSPFCTIPADIFGQDDLNNLIAKSPSVEQQHFKLWLPSTTVLQRLLHNRVYAESAVAIDEISQQLALFVPTDVIPRALKLIEQYGYCLLTGIPGIGKTTTARILVAQHIEKDWEAYCITSDAGAAFDVFDPDKKQIFLYDDFLGQTNLVEKFAKNEDQQLLNLIRACRKAPAKKRLVLTTRDHLLAQAIQEHERLQRSNLSLSECAVKLEHYTERIRAQILVNHLYVFGVEPEVCSQLVESGVAKSTLNHKHYNPRIVESACVLQASNPSDATAFGERFLAMLDDPKEIWRYAYNQQLSKTSKKILLLFAVFGNRAMVSALQAAFEAYSSHVGDSSVGTRTRFLEALDELEGNFVAITPSGSLTFVTYHNPSIKDFTDRLLTEEPLFVKEVLDSCPFDEPLVEAARILRETAPNRIAASDLLAAMQRGNSKASVRVTQDRQGHNYSFFWNRAKSLPLWLRWISEISNPSDGMLAAALAAVESFLRRRDYCFQPLDELTKLYKEYAQCFEDNSAPPFSPVEFVELCIPDCSDPEDFVALSSLTEGVEGGGPVRERLLATFDDKVSDWIDELLVHSDSSDEAFSAVQSATEAADALGLELDFGIHHDRAEEMHDREENMADLSRDDFHQYRGESTDAESEVDDILDSLRA